MKRARPALRARVVPATCLIALLTLVGCSDSDNGNETSTPTSTASTVRPVDTSFTGEGSAEFCQFIKTFNAGSEVSPSASPAELEADFNESLAAINQAVTVAPAEIKPDVVAIADSFKTVVTAVSNANFDLTKIDGSALAALQTEGFLDAVTRLQAYLNTYCGGGG